jgi:hypothetical protein
VKFKNGNLKIKGTAAQLNLISGQNSARVRNGAVRSNIFVFAN